MIKKKKKSEPNLVYIKQGRSFKKIVVNIVAIYKNPGHAFHGNDYLTPLLCSISQQVWLKCMSRQIPQRKKQGNDTTGLNNFFLERNVTFRNELP